MKTESFENVIQNVVQGFANRRCDAVIPFDFACHVANIGFADPFHGTYVIAKNGLQEDRPISSSRDSGRRGFFSTCSIRDYTEKNVKCCTRRTCFFDGLWKSCLFFWKTVRRCSSPDCAWEVGGVISWAPSSKLFFFENMWFTKKNTFEKRFRIWFVFNLGGFLKVFMYLGLDVVGEGVHLGFHLGDHLFFQRFLCDSRGNPNILEQSPHQLSSKLKVVAAS